MTLNEDSNIKLLEWPTQSPDLNPIENLWNLLDAKVEGWDGTRKTIGGYELLVSLKLYNYK